MEQQCIEAPRPACSQVHDITGTRAFKRWFRRSKAVNPDGSPRVCFHGTADAGFRAFDHSKIDAHHVGFFFSSSQAVAETYGSCAPVELRRPPAVKTIADLRRYLQDQEEFVGKRLRMLERQQVLDDETDAPRIYREFVLYWEGGGSFIEVGEYRPSVKRSDLQRLFADAFAAVANGPRRCGMYSVYLSLQKPLVVDAGGVPWNSVLFERSRMHISGISHIAKERGYDGLIVRDVYDSNIFLDTPSDVYVAFAPQQIKSATDNTGEFSAASADLLA